MRRAYRLSAPAISFATVGFIVLLIANTDRVQVHGGEIALSAYALAWQLLLSLLLVVSIDDFGAPLPRSSDSARPVGLPYSSFRRALLDYYRSRFTAMLLLSFGVGASTSRLIAAIGPHIPGLCIHLVGCGSGKEYTLAGAMVISAIALTFLGVGLPALAGWWCGYSLAVALFEARFPSFNYLNRGTWGLAVALVAVLLLVRAVIALMRTLLRRRRQQELVQPPGPVPTVASP